MSDRDRRSVRRSAATPRAPADGRRTLRRLTRLTASRFGLEDQAVGAYEALQRALESPSVRRNRRDDERVRLLAAGLLGADSNCVDVGANQGQLLSAFVALAPHGRHIAYEPVPDLAASLAERFPQIEVRAAAVSDHGGQAEFIINTRLPSRSSLRDVGHRSAETRVLQVPLERLDESLPAGYVPHLLKIDVEGAEHLVLEGARATLRTHRPVVVFEHQRSTASHFGSGPERIFALLVNDLDMRIFDLDGAGPYSLPGFRRVYERGTRWNFFAVPRAGRRPDRTP